MRFEREESPVRSRDRSPRDTHAQRTTCGAQNARQSAPETSTGRLGNRALLSQMHSMRKRAADAAPTRETRGAGITSQLHDGRRLDETTRSLMESRFGQSFGDVRVHTGGPAAGAADSLRARAFTVGGNIVFAAGQFAPGSAAGQRLLAHELAHVVQQRRTAGTVAGEHATEQDAQDAAKDLARGVIPVVRERAEPGRVQKQERPPEELAKMEELKRLNEQAEISTLEPAAEQRRKELREELQRLENEHLGLAAPPVFKVLPGKPSRAALDLSPEIRENLRKQGFAVDQPDGPVVLGDVDPAMAAAAMDAMKKGRSTHVIAPPDPNFPFFPSLAPPPQPLSFLGPLWLPFPSQANPPVLAPRKPSPPPPPEDPEITLARKRAGEVTALAAAGSHEELVKFFKGLDRRGFEQLQNQLGSRMEQVLDSLSDFEAVLVGSLGPVRFGREKLTEKRENYMLDIRKYGSLQSPIFYGWMFSNMSNEEADALLKQLAADQRLKHTVLSPGTEGLQSLIRARGIDLDKYKDRPWEATDIARGLFEGASDMLKSGEDFRLFNTLQLYQEVAQLPPEYQKRLDEVRSGASKEYWEFPEKHPIQTAGYALDAALLHLPSSTIGAGVGLGTGAYHLSEGNVDDAFRDFLPALIILISHAGGKALGGAAASEELSLLGPEYKAPPGPRLTLPSSAATTGAWEEFFQTDRAGNLFKVVIDRSTGTGNATHVASGKMIFFENGQLVRGPIALLPQQTAVPPPFDPFAGVPSSTTPIFPGLNPQPFWLPSGTGAPLLTLPRGGTSLLGPPTGLPLLPPLGAPKLLPSAPPPLVVRPGMTLKEMREAQVLKQLFPGSRQLEEKYAAYDGFEGGTETLRYHVDEVKNGVPITVISRTISGANMISLKELDPAGPGVKGTVEERIVDNVHEALEAAYQRIGKPIVGVKGQTPVTGTTDVYLRTTVENPSKISIVIQVPEPVTKAMETAAKQAVAADTRRLEMPPIDVQVVQVH